METPFAELLGRSCFSFLEGASKPEEMVGAARDFGLFALALCDRDGLYGSVRAHAEAKKVGQRVIVGAELTLEREGVIAPRTPARAPHTVALLAADREGYANLCRLLTLAHEDHEKGTAGVAIERVAEHARGLVAVVPLEARRERRGGADAILGPIADAFGGRAFLATWRHKDGLDAARTEAAIDASTFFDLPIVASARPLYHLPSRKPLADVLHCIRHKTTLDQAGRALTANADAYLRPAARMRLVFPDQPGWIARTVEVAAMCRFSLDELRYHFPSETLCRPGETADDALRRTVEEGCLRRYPQGVPTKVREQIEKELALIGKIGVAAYFLSVHQIIEMARAKKILCQGRGSAANSAVCYVLGVTAVDPARSELLFERFLSEERREPPDIDVDFEHERREEIIQEIYSTYGRDRAAMVSEVISYRGRSALREVGKAFGLSTDQVDRLAGLVLHMNPEGLSDARIAEAGLDPRDPRLKKAIWLASELDGFPRHLSIHVGGFVISAEPLTHVAPIEPARMEGRTVVPWDKDDIDELGFFKLDVLGLGMLTAIRKCLGMVAEREGRPFDPIEALANIPAEKKEVYEAIQRADTIGVFQIESRAQMSMLPRLKPEKFYDLVVEVAIVRPGPIQGGMVHPYLRRRAGKESANAPHPCLDPILERTLGVPLFQEQVMQIAMVAADYTPGEADQLRRDMAAWKKHGRIEQHKPRLLAGFAKRGISPEFGEQLFQQILGFGEYGFPESHAASFALLVYASSYLKVHHPAAFACALLNSQPMGFYSPSSITKDAQRHGVEVRPICVLHSAWDASLEDPGPALRLGLRLVRGFGERAAKLLVAARAEVPFTSLQDLIQRAHLRKNDIEALAEAGALAALVPERRDALWKARAPREGGLFEGLDIESGEPAELAPMPALEQLTLDYERVGFAIHDHPMIHLRPGLRRRGVRLASDLSALRHGSTVLVAGLVIGRQRPGSANGITFITLEDESGMVNLIVRRELFDEKYRVARHAKLMLVKGRVERQGEVVHVLAQDLERLRLPGGGDLVARSRDFH